MDTKPNITADRKLIESLGGSAQVAKTLNFGLGGVQRVDNWKRRGIPAAVKLDWPHIFLSKRRGLS
ncbi:hypothetical protein AWB66_01507 [Caballeronia telluris]|uniref:DNA-binding protein n=1 Tax=Caballeronia telluris TaxID=326475 RepID=A0A158G3R0_9BURK|nr:hypothetical protein AWB66_01507 [Caballeronia telluris]